MKAKISLFCNLSEQAVITAKDVASVYEVPLVLAAEGLDDPVVLEHDHGQRAAGEIDAGDAPWPRPLGEGDDVSVRVVVGRGAFVRVADDLCSGRNGLRVRCAEVVDSDLELRSQLDAERVAVEACRGSEIPHMRTEDGPLLFHSDPDLHRRPVRTRHPG